MDVSRAKWWLPVATLVAVALAVAFVVLRRQTPAPVDAPETGFSAVRAFEVLERVAGDQAPHGVGTPANAAVRERIVGELEAVGLAVELQSTFACRATVCAPVVNVVAEIPGREEGPAVMIVSHYDSVHAGPGVGDDLQGVAIAIEVARSIVASGPPRNPVLLLIDEGEEVGLLGAQAFAAEHAAAARVGVVVNVEARGTTGLSSMFQTSDGNAELVRALIESTPRPRATSLAYEVYRRMPNNTDFSVLAEYGMAGLNFAFIGGVARYHTPLDDLQHLDQGSLQHQGESVHATVLALAERDLPLPAVENLVYADVLGFFVVRFRQAWTVPIAAVLIVLIVALVVVASRKGRIRPARCGLGAAAAIGVVLLVTCTGFGLTLFVSTRHGEGVAALAQPFPFRIALWSLAALVGLCVAAWLRAFAEPLELAFGVALTWACGALALAAFVPGAAMQFLLPLFVAVVALGVATLRSSSGELVMFAIAATIVWTDVALGLEDAFGLLPTPLVGAPLGVLWSAIVPCLVTDRRGWVRLGGVALASTVVATVWASLVPVYDEASPRRVAITHFEDRTMELSADALASPGHPGAELLAAAPFPSAPERVVSWLPWPVWSTPSPMTDALAPIIEDGRFRSPRGADRAILVFPPGSILGLRVEGRGVAIDDAGETKVYLFGVPHEGVALEFDGPKRGASVTLVDCSAALPDSALALVAARPATAGTFQWGDTSCIASTVPLAGP